MKIKTKILVWYGISFLLLITIFIVATASIAQQSIVKESEYTVKNITTDIVGNVEIVAGVAYYEEDEEYQAFDFTKDTVIFVIYQNDTLYLGNPPNSLTTDLPLASNTIQKIEAGNTTWLIYDAVIDDTYTLRGYYSTLIEDQTFNQVFLWMLIISPIFVLISLSGGFWIVKLAFKPMDKVTDTALEITKEHRYDVRIPHRKKKDEIAILATTINEMLDSIESAISREKSFTSNVSHELRTPLSVLHAQIEYLQDKNKNTSLNKDIEDILSQLHFMEQLVNNLLDWVRASNIEMDLDEKVEVNMVIQSIMESFELKPNPRNIAFEFKPFSKEIQLETNINAFIRIFNNLISNAIKYNKDNGKIIISISEKDSQCSILIKDTGIGMNESELSQALNPFYRADKSRNSKESLGIGLSITDSLIKNLNGSLEIKSEKNKGTEVKVTFEIK